MKPANVIAAEALQARKAATAKVAIELGDHVLWGEAIWCIRGNQDSAYKFDGFEFLREPLESQAEELAIMASSGCGKTEGFLGLFAMMEADSGRRVIYAFENKVKMSLIVQERVNPNIEGSPYLKQRVEATDNVTLKKVGNGVIFFLGANESSSKTFHCDTLILDERDAMDPQIVEDMEKRTVTSTAPKRRKISNPDQPGRGIHNDYINGDQRRWN